MEEYVNTYNSETRLNKRGKTKKNKKYNAEFATQIEKLEKSKHTYTITNDPNALFDESNLGEFNVTEDGKNLRIVVPKFNKGEKGKGADLAGGRKAILAEEVFHATRSREGFASKRII